MQLKKQQIVEIPIHALAFGGAGIGKYHGLTVFVKGTMPGDRVRVAFTKIRQNFAEADLVEVVEPSEDRVQPVCQHFDKCGGCQLQFMPYEKQLEFKKQHVIDAFERIGKIYEPPVRDVLGCSEAAGLEALSESGEAAGLEALSESGEAANRGDAGRGGPGGREPFFYRNKMEFSFGYDAEMNFALGLHVPGRRFDILDLKECHLQSAFSVQILRGVREFCLANGWMPHKFATGEGFLRSLYIREGKRTGEVMVNLSTTDAGLPEDFEDELKNFVKMLTGLEGSGERDPQQNGLNRSGESIPRKIVSIYWLRKVAKRGRPTVIKEKLIFGKASLTEKMILDGDRGGDDGDPARGDRGGDELVFDILPQTFFQVNTLQAEVLYSQVLEAACREEHDTIFDLFCGTGTIALFLAKHCRQVWGVELNADAVKVARENASKNKIFNVDFFVGDVAKVLYRMRERPSLIVVDPPRAGLTQRMIEKMNDFGSSKIIYVSCNPATLARDCALLGEYGYKVLNVQPVDMFPHTFHVECVASLGR